MTDQPDGPVFNVTPFPPTPTQHDCLFLITNLTTGTVYEVRVERDAMGFYEMVVDGSERYAIEDAPPYVTFPILDATDRMYAEADAEAEAHKHTNDVVDATIAALAMRSDADKRRVQ